MKYGDQEFIQVRMNEESSHSFYSQSNCIITCSCVIFHQEIEQSEIFLSKSFFILLCFIIDACILMYSTLTVLHHIKKCEIQYLLDMIYMFTQKNRDVLYLQKRKEKKK